MTTKISTGLAGYLLGTGSLRQAMASSFLRVYSGTAPATADAAIPAGAELLVEISLDGTGGGLSLATAPQGAIITKDTAQVWRGTAGKTGVATFFRWVTTGDNGEASASRLRIQGDVAVAGAELNFSSTAMTAGAIQKVDYFAVAMPSS